MQYKQKNKKIKKNKKNMIIINIITMYWNNGKIKIHATSCDDQYKQ